MPELLVAQNIVGYQHILNLRHMGDHSFGFRDLLAGYADCTSLDLHKRNCW